MLLNYLYRNFLEECHFVEDVGTTTDDLRRLIETRVFPSASYIYESEGRSTSFVADFSDKQTYRFHLRGHRDWYRDVTQLGLTTEARARSHFFSRYEQAKRAFLASPLELQAQGPAVAGQFDSNHADSTWDHFLKGVYSVCTRDGRPESVFLKQAGVFFVEQMIAEGQDALSQSQKKLLRRAVGFLNGVESDFAPHELPQTSRQRCIIDVMERFLDEKAA